MSDKIQRPERWKNRIWEKYWMLTVLERVNIEKEIRDSKYRCMCDCWEEAIVSYRYLVRDWIASCWCTMRNWKPSWKAKAKMNIWKKFNKLTIDEIIGKCRESDWKSEMRANCSCECGSKKCIKYTNIVDGNTKSCWCTVVLRSSLWLCNTRERRMRYSIVKSCYSPTHSMYKNRGGKWVKVHEKWRYFTWWWEDNKQSYSDEKYFTRLNPFKDFTPDNCMRNIAYNASRFDLYDKYRE